MPTVINGIGTWYYGKSRIHTLKGTCEFCGRHTELVSYDTTLFFVVVFVPVIPLGQKRILQQCSACQQHRVISKAKWEEAKQRDGAELLEKLRQDPDNRDAILQAIGFAIAYQDEPLFNNIVESLVGQQTGDAVLQARLGDAYAYFARWSNAEQAYRASLAVEDNEVIREQLALMLLKQGQPDEALPYLQHVLDQKKVASAGMLYLLVNAYQAQGRHEEALKLMDAHDEAFPQWLKDRDYQRQRKTSLRYQGTGKKVRSDLLDQGKAGYREGNWTAKLPYAIAALLLLGTLGLYLGSALWIGQARKVYLINGTGRPYSVVIRGSDHALAPHSVTPIRIAEGDLQVAFKDDRLASESVQARIETPFWTRPFAGATFLINPDQSAIVLEEEALYSAVNPQPPRQTVHFGHEFYSLPGVDYEFEDFPLTISVKGNQQVRKTRVALAPALASQAAILLQRLDKQEQIALCRRLLQIDPGETLLLNWLAFLLSPDELIQFLQTRLDDRPILVEWHRAYQTQMERAHPETDLRPRYRKLLAEAQGHADAVYLLGRAEPDLEESDKLYRQAAAMKPPAAYAFYSLGYRAMSQARFGEAVRWLEQGLPLLADKNIVEPMYHDALLANGEYDRLLEWLKKDTLLPGRQQRNATLEMRVYAIRGDKARAQKKIDEAVAGLPPQDRDSVKKSYEAMLCCCEKDVKGYLKNVDSKFSFESAFLRGQLKQAAALVSANIPDASAYHGLLYLQATRSGDKELARTQWEALLADLKKGGREEKLFAEMLAGRTPPAGDLPQKVSVYPNHKRVLLAVLAQRYPEQAKETLALARKLDYQRDGISLCLDMVLKER